MAFRQCRTQAGFHIRGRKVVAEALSQSFEQLRTRKRFWVIVCPSRDLSPDDWSNDVPQSRIGMVWFVAPGGPRM